MNRSAMNRSALLWLLATLVFGLLACVTSLEGSDVPPQSWWKERGPVVRHDTFPADCSLCHAGDDWHTIRDDFEFDHEAETGVALEGAHAAAECIRCHNDRGPVGVFARRGCAGCHEDVHRGQLGQDCTACHDQLTWRPSGEIALHNRTRFPLVGSHAAVACWRCHIGAEVGNFTPVDTECVSCHADDLARATDPDHVASGFVSNCDRCHIPTTWDGRGFNHPGFPLTGAHRALDCSECHLGGVFTGTPRDCFACHMDDYNGAPDHVTGNFPTNCEQCHSTNTWEGADFDHQGIVTGCAVCHLDDYNGTDDPDHALEGFSTNCEDCHTTNRWEGAMFSHVGITNGCAACHLDDYNGTNDPDHALEGFATTCEDCHTTDRWEGAMFSHVGITNGCDACHLDDFVGTTDPNHTAAGFPVTCETCHLSTNTWNGAVFDHDFPIENGPHRTLDCSDCHLSPMNYSMFSCTHCHEHRQSEADDEHSDVDGYVWESGACYACHPNGNR